MGTGKNYRNLVYFATALTGFSALCGQVVWQKYLTILVGSEARSMSLVVAVFLFGLALGYWFFGKLTERKKWLRVDLMRFYGIVELITALYFFIFHFYYKGLVFLSFHSPALMIVDIFIALLALFLPVFLMGASIPLLTVVLPDRPGEINHIHSRIYGWNTVGAFIGVLTAGFYLIPAFGFMHTLFIAGGLNSLAGVIFIVNRLKGHLQKKEEPPLLPSALSNRFLMAFVFLTGAVVISLEILFVRLLNLSIGAGGYNFPLILSLFVGGLGAGSLLLPTKISSGYFIRQLLFSVFFLGTAYVTAPYWSAWLSHIRVTLTSSLFNWYRFKLEVWIFLFFFIFPIAFFMGRLLPLSYSFLKKTKNNYGTVCGYLYFFNTLGTVFGAVVIGYLAFYIFNLDSLFKVNFILLAALSGYIVFQERRKLAGIVIASFIAAFFFFPQWNRVSHGFGYFRQRTPAFWHFQKLFYLPDTAPGNDRPFLEDGPNSTVSILSHKSVADISIAQKIIPQITESYSVIVNGKSDGNLLNDFSTTFLASSLAYLFAPEGSALSTAVIGLGTGVSAGVLGKIKNVKDVVVLEISHAVISALKSISSYKFDVMSNPKIRIVERDAFRYFTRTDKKFDLIVSEPSNPWVAGVENLFSLEFYKLAKKKLRGGGVLAQWLYIYSMDAATFRMICNTIRQVFPFVELYVVGHSDVILLAGKKPFQHGDVFRKRFSDPFLLTIHKSIGLPVPENIRLIQVLESDRFTEAFFSGSGLHSLTKPKLTYRSDKAFFLGGSTSLFDILNGPLQRFPEMEKNRAVQFIQYLKISPDEIPNYCLPVPGFNFFCNHIAHAVEQYHLYWNKENHISVRFQSYGRLRILGYIFHDKDFMGKVRKWLIKEAVQSLPVLFGYIDQTILVEGYERTLSDMKQFTLNERDRKILVNYINEIKKSADLRL